MVGKNNQLFSEVIKPRLLVLNATIVSTALLVLLIMSLLQWNEARATGPTYVSGGIFTDTTWSAIQSPYIVTDTVVLFPSYILTVEPGVEVRFVPGTDLIIRGTLVAEGTTSNHIVLTSNDSNPIEGSWGGIDIVTDQGGIASVKFADISYSLTGLEFIGHAFRLPGNHISDSVFSNNVRALFSVMGEEEMQVKRCIFENNTSYAVSGDGMKISNSVFNNNGLGISGGGRVYKSTFINNHTAIERAGEIVASKIINNGIGIYPGTSRLFHNTIAYNEVGVILNFLPSIEYNNIYSNTEYNIRNASSFNMDVSNNWWGTTDTSVIEESIYDGRDDPLLGLIYYQPILQERQGDEWIYLPSVTNQP